MVGTPPLAASTGASSGCCTRVHDKAGRIAWMRAALLEGCNESTKWAIQHVHLIISSSSYPCRVVKNIWSTYWGEGGYIRIDMDHDCGTSVVPEYVDLDVHKTELMSQGN
jgi:Papain family cysteine protease